MILRRFVVSDGRRGRILHLTTYLLVTLRDLHIAAVVSLLLHRRETTYWGNTITVDYAVFLSTEICAIFIRNWKAVVECLYLNRTDCYLVRLLSHFNYISTVRVIFNKNRLHLVQIVYFRAQKSHTLRTTADGMTYHRTRQDHWWSSCAELGRHYISAPADFAVSIGSSIAR